MKTIVAILAIVGLFVVGGRWAFFVLEKPAFDSSDYAISIWFLLLIVMSFSPKRNDQNLQAPMSGSDKL